MNEDKIIEKLIEHDEKLDRLLTREEFNEFKDDFFQGQDQVMTVMLLL